MHISKELIETIEAEDEARKEDSALVWIDLFEPLLLSASLVGVQCALAAPSGSIAHLRLGDGCCQFDLLDTLSGRQSTSSRSLFAISTTVFGDAGIHRHLVHNRTIEVMNGRIGLIFQPDKPSSDCPRRLQHEQSGKEASFSKRKNRLVNNMADVHSRLS